MINQFTFSAITNAVLALKSANKKIYVDKAGPVEILMRASYTPLLTDSSISDTVFYDEFPNSLKRDVITGDTDVMEFSNDGKPFADIPVAQHEVTFSELRRAMSSNVVDLLNFCRDTIHPAIEAIFNRFEDPKLTQSKELWSLVPIPEPQYLKTAVFESILAKTPKGNISTAVISERPSLIPDTLEVPKTGHAVFDKVVNELIDSLKTTPAETISKMWTEPLSAPQSPRAWENVPHVALALLLAVYYKDNPWENSGMSLATWEDTFDTQIIRQSQWIRDHIENMVFRIENGLVVSHYDVQQRRVFLIHSVWEKYLEKGGVVESLHGALCRIENNEAYDITTDNLLTDEQQNVKTWETFHAINEASNTAEWLSETQMRLTRAVCEWVDSVEDDSIFPYDGWRDDAPAMVFNYVKSTLDIHELQDLTLYLIGLLFDSAFSHVDGRKLMINIHTLVKDGVPIKNATYFAVREYLENYVFSGLMLEV